ncbi:hypothetical protein DFH09DRAFT_1167884 [Mycena vulgaris]|nr:hypothetical protein DFH09DRAFT_1167884 [Mycena vulgaris]
MSTNSDGAALEELKLTLNEIQSYLILLAKPRRRLRPWIFANHEKDRFAQLNVALDKALAKFSATKILSTAEDVRATAVDVRAITVDVGVLVASVERLERSDNDVKGSLTIIHAKLDAASAPRSCEGCAREEYRITPFVSFWASSQLMLFFLDLDGDKYSIAPSNSKVG